MRKDENLNACVWIFLKTCFVKANKCVIFKA